MEAIASDGFCLRRRLILYFYVLVLVFTHCDARKSNQPSKDISFSRRSDAKHLTILEVAKNLNMVLDVSVRDSSVPNPYVSSPLTLPPYDSLSPIPLPDTNSPPYCVYPPPNPQSPSSTMPNPIGYSPTPPSPSSSNPSLPILSPPPGSEGTTPSPPETSPITNPPETIVPGPPGVSPSPFIYVPNPPYYEPSPPSGNVPGPPQYVPSPVGFSPSPPIFQPPVVYPPPTVPPPPFSGGGGGGGKGVWCVAKPSVPDPIIQEAMNYACGSGADCSPIQPNGPCFDPNTLLQHASYAFNSYWQRTKVAGGTCEFGGTAMLVTVDPSSDGCHFVNN